MREGGDMRSFILLPVLFMGWAAGAAAPGAQSTQNIKIFGKVFVKDENETGYEPALGAAVRVMSPSKGMVVDAQGAFEFMLPSVNTEVVVSYVGQKEQRVSAAQCVNGCEIRLVEDPTVLDEVVVVGCAQPEQVMSGSPVATLQAAPQTAQAPIVKKMLSPQL